jgi:hypothetical protein
VSHELAKVQPIENCVWQARPESILALRSLKRLSDGLIEKELN